MKVYITNHAMEQLKMRKHYEEDSVIKMSQRAWDYGMRTSDFSGGTRRSLESAIKNHEGQETVIRIYKGMRYIFTYDGGLITAYRDVKSPKKGAGRNYRSRSYDLEIKEYEYYYKVDALIA